MAARPTKEWKAATVCGNAMGLTSRHPSGVSGFRPGLVSFLKKHGQRLREDGEVGLAETGL